MPLAHSWTVTDIDDVALEETRLWARVDRGEPDDCWPWQGPISTRGYGITHLRMQGQWRAMQAHRLAYLLAYGQLPAPSHCVRHKVCGQPLCCNPAHLAAGSYRDNSADREAMGHTARGERNAARLYPDRLARGLRNGAFTHPDRVPRGERHSSRTHPERQARGEQIGVSKLTPEAVRDIRRLRAEGLSQGVLARMFGVSKATIQDIEHGRIWRHIT